MIISIDSPEKIEFIKSKNRDLAKKALLDVIEDYKNRLVREILNLPVEEIPLESLKDYAAVLQAHVDDPPIDVAYQPPLPPGVPEPDVAAITAVITREPGWNNVLGYRIILTISDPSYVPSNLALAIYNAANCTGYKFTTGAFQFDAGLNQYFSVCPPGFEPGSSEVHMGLLYGSAPLSCWTLGAGAMNKEILIYQS